MYQSISFNDVNFKQKLVNEYKENGLVVINDVFTDNECDNLMDGIITSFEQLGTGIDKNKLETWTTYNTPPQTRPGLFQSLVSNLKEVWTIRSHNNVRTIFEMLYSDVRGKPIKDFMVSGDGINIRPNINPIHKSTSNDWPHVDQTIRNDVYRCIQGQAVLTNTTASFVASPKSHLIFDKLLDKLKIDENDKSNWLKFDKIQTKIANLMIKELKGQWQIPILSKKGSFIVWSSTLIHSAKLQDKIELPSLTDKYLGWRGVVYVCYRPTSEFTSKEIKKRIDVYENNRTTNHWGTKMFPKTPGGRYLYIDKRHSVIEEMIKDPLKVYQKIGKPILNNEEKKLLNL